MLIRTNQCLAAGANGYWAATHSADAATGGRIEARMPGTKRLFVLRHAKSSWDDPGLDDHERPLAPRGRRACAGMAEHIRTAGIAPDVVLCSTARRTRETLEGVDPPGERLIEDALYSASAQDLLDRLHRLPDDVGSVMLIGHNPAVQMLVLRLARRDDEQQSGRAAVERKFPTGALAALTFECDWEELGPGSARLAAFLRPKELNGSSVTGAGAPAPRA
jgi:phosphohistidine phosphatase